MKIPLAQASTILGGAGAVVYVYLMYFYDRFYAAINLSPEDVGLTRSVIVGRAILGVTAVAVSILAISSAGAMLYRVAAKAKQKTTAAEKAKAAEGRDEKNRLGSGWSKELVVGFALAFLLIAALVYDGIVRVGGMSATMARGEVPNSTTFAGLRVLDIRVTPCSVAWLGEDSDEPEALSSDLYCLGAANGQSVFWTRSETLKIPSSQIVVSFP